MSTPARWAVLGAGVISGDFSRALPAASHSVLHAVAARDARRARAFADEFGAPVAGTYDEILARDDIDAVYIGTVHTSHVELGLAALAAGKAVLCEKPVGVSVAETERLLEAAASAGLPLLEAFKYRFGPFPERVRDLIASGALGEITAVSSQLGFPADRSIRRLFDPALAGGGILDVGCYPVSLAVGVAAGAGRLDPASVAVTSADGTIGETGVDEDTHAELDLGGIRATVATSIVREVPRRVTITGTEATLEIANVWGSRVESTGDAVLRHADGRTEDIVTAKISPMAAEADAVVLALREGRTEVPEMTWAQTRATARLLEDWRAALD